MSENGHVVNSLDGLKATAACQEPIRYLSVPVERFGTARFRSLTAGELMKIAGKDDEHILPLSMVDENGHRWVGDEELALMKSDDFDGRVLNTLCSLALQHCTRDSVDDLILEAAKNSSSGQTS